MAKKKNQDGIALILAAVKSAKERTIRRIYRQLALMSANELALLERLLGKR